MLGSGGGPGGGRAVPGGDGGAGGGEGGPTLTLLTSYGFGSSMQSSVKARNAVETTCGYTKKRTMRR